MTPPFVKGINRSRKPPRHFLVNADHIACAEYDDGSDKVTIITSITDQGVPRKYILEGEEALAAIKILENL